MSNNNPSLASFNVSKKSSKHTVQFSVKEDAIHLIEEKRSEESAATEPKKPYHIVCKNRYLQAKRKYHRQLQDEMEILEIMQPSAYEALRFNKHFAISTLWPPLHTRREIDYVLREFYKLPPKDRDRLNFLLREKQY